MTVNDFEYIDKDGSQMLVKNLPLNRFFYTRGTDGDAKYDIYVATKDRFCFCQAWENEDSTLWFGIAFSVIKDNILNLSLPDAHEGIGYFTLASQHEVFPGTDKENDFKEHVIKNSNIYTIISELNAANRTPKSPTKNKPPKCWER